MTIESDLRLYLVGVSGITSMVSGRVYQLVAPEHPVYPLIRMQVIDDIEGNHLTAQGRIFWTRIQFDSYVDVTAEADPYTAATDIGTAIHDALGLTLVSSFVGPPPRLVRGILLQDRSVGYEADELRLIRERRDYIVQHALA